MSKENLVVEVGDLVEPDPNQTNDIFHCGTGRYATAVVVSLDPFIMVSLSGEMMWLRWNLDDVRVVMPSTYDLEPITKRIENEILQDPTQDFKQWFEYLNQLEEEREGDENFFRKWRRKYGKSC